MLAPYLKSKVGALWNHFWTAGITNPLVAIEQITYLLFLKRLEGLDSERVKQDKTSVYDKRLHDDGDRCRWSYIKEEPDDVNHLIEAVFPWLREIERIIADADKLDQAKSGDGESELTVVGNRMSDAYFQLDPNKGAILSQAIVLIDELFSHVDASSVDDDLMGDIFEYLLSEVSSSGKNGQFRTPRHIIRVLVELLDPKPGEWIIDPAAGTGGFLFSAMSHIMKENTPDDMLKLEWDGTPHRAYGTELSEEQYDAVHQGNYYVGLDNDRTMVRIGWMNMILHGISNPQIHQRDSLGKVKDDDALKDTLASESFKYVLANPPFTGTVDKGSLDLAIFPKAGTSPKKAKLALTDKSELLFIWRMLDLLEVGGRCAVIIPEGVMFGSTEAHVRLRRELLTEHTVEAVISLPGGAFQPYTGVKTSVVVFQKDTPKAEKAADGIWFSEKTPRTERVWFYEVEEEAFEPTAKRGERKGLDNDLWDMLEKFRNRLDGVDEELDYYKPEYHEQRWRLVDDSTLKVFPDNRAVSGEKGKVVAIHDLFPELPEDPEAAVKQIDTAQRKQLKTLIKNSMLFNLREANISFNELHKEKNVRDQHLKQAQAAFKRQLRTLLQGKEKTQVFEQDNSLAEPLFRQACKDLEGQVLEQVLKELSNESKFPLVAKKGGKDTDEAEVGKRLVGISGEYAKLDGFNVMLRSIRSVKHEKHLEKNKKESKSWWADVRVYARDDEWLSADGALQSSHDDSGVVRPEYLKTIELYNEKGKLNEQYLDPECIEARGWNLAAGQYKPFNFTAIENEQSVAEMIAELEVQEQQIMDGLGKLKIMVGIA